MKADEDFADANAGEVTADRCKVCRPWAQDVVAVGLVDGLPDELLGKLERDIGAMPIVRRLTDYDRRDSRAGQIVPRLVPLETDGDVVFFREPAHSPPATPPVQPVGVWFVREDTRATPARCHEVEPDFWQVLPQEADCRGTEYIASDVAADDQQNAAMGKLRELGPPKPVRRSRPIPTRMLRAVADTRGNRVRTTSHPL